ncbi:hypothetical protein [uncultured Sanguibacteroides sp.]|uniref:hypothetical protein n=1 Tax=uncultured Sanguibacteroides sp. TaxID=1635151 RepID=UPI0025F96C90|nr:hypothetical protein [uncultured Sanguibacteroides sp.]
MKINKEIKKAFLIIMVCLAMISIIDRPYKEREKRIFRNPEFAIGEVINYKPSRGGPSKVEFTYNRKGKEYKNKYSAGIYLIPPRGVGTRDRYLVVFVKDEPEEGIMLFNYPVKDSTDYII